MSLYKKPPKKNKKVLLDNIIFNLQVIGGISNYWFNLIRQSIENDNIFYLEENNNQNKNDYRNKIKLPSDYILENVSMLPLKIKRYLPVKGKDKSFDIFHSSYYRYAKGNIKNVTTVHDFMYEKYLSKYDVRRMVHSKQKYQAIKHSEFIIGVSQNTLNDLLQYFPEFKDKNMRVIYHGASDDFYLIKKKQPYITIQNQKLWNNAYFFYFGGRKGYKNFNLLIDAYSELLKKYKNIPDLVIASGGKFSENEKRLLAESGILKRTIKLAKLTNRELNCLYNHCTAFIYPSLYEGFGLPVLEAMQAGAPVICSNSSSLPEVAGEAAIYIDPANAVSLEKALYSLLKDDTRKDLKGMSRKQAEKFSWKSAYEKTLEVYDSI